MAAERKKVIVNADLIEFQDLSPRTRHHLLCWSSRCNKFDGLLARGKLRSIDCSANAGNIPQFCGNTGQNSIASDKSRVSCRA